MGPSILSEIFRDVSLESLASELPTIMDIVAKIADDPETSVRTDLMQRIPSLASTCAEYGLRVPAIGEVTLNHLLPIVMNCLNDPDNQVRGATHAALNTLIEQRLIPKHVIKKDVCPKVVEFTHCESSVDYSTGAVSLMAKMASLLGREITERLFLERFVELCSSSIFYVRKICSFNFGEFCTVVGPESFEKLLLPCFVQLCTDEAWGVRKACAEVVMSVSCACSPKLRREILAPAFAALLKDVSRWVRMSAFQTLGPFIATFADPSVVELAYNQMGKLVIVNPAGFEFRLNSPAFTDINDMKQHSIASRTSSTDLLKEDRWKDTEIFELLSENDPTKTSNYIEVVIGDEEIANEPADLVEKVNTKFEAGDSNDNVVDNEVVDIKNCVTSEEKGEKCIKEEDVLENIQENSDLNNFNSFQYWYINPDLPLDPDITVEIQKRIRPPQDEKTFVHQLEEINFSTMWNYPLDKSKRSDSLTTVCDAPISENAGQTKITQHIVPQVLIDHFVSMVDPELAQNTDSDMAFHCAFCLPAVALTLGKNNWLLLKKTCSLLASDMQYKIRKTIACCLHELAIILGQEMTAVHLLPIFDDFLKDLDEVRIGVLKHLAHFLMILGPQERKMYLPRLPRFLETDTQWNWRFREELGNQLLMIIPLVKRPSASKYIGALSQELLCDKAFAVRQVAISLVTELARYLSCEIRLVSRLLIFMAEEFAHSTRWIRRQTFALVCSQLISKNALSPEQFTTIVMPHLLDLSWDPVANVRLAVSRTLARDIIIHEYFADKNSEVYEQVHTVLRRLQADKDTDVRQFAIPASQ